MGSRRKESSAAFMRVPRRSSLLLPLPPFGLRVRLDPLHNRSSALDDSYQEDDDRHHEQQVDQATDSVRRNQSEQPQREENHGDGKHQFHSAKVGARAIPRDLPYPAISQRCGGPDVMHAPGRYDRSDVLNATGVA